MCGSCRAVIAATYSPHTSYPNSNLLQWHLASLPLVSWGEGSNTGVSSVLFHGAQCTEQSVRLSSPLHAGQNV